MGRQPFQDEGGVGQRSPCSSEWGENRWALTRDFKETVKARAERDVAFREALLTEAVEQLIAGEVEVGKAVLRDIGGSSTISE
jgi:hypothetical protein